MSNTQASRGFWWKPKPERFMRSGQYVALSVFIQRSILPFYYYSSLERNTENAESLHRVSMYLWRDSSTFLANVFSASISLSAHSPSLCLTTLDPRSMGCQSATSPSPVDRASKEHFEINRHLIHEVGDELDLPHTCKLLAHSPPALTAHQRLG